MDRLKAMEVFVTAAEAGSYARASEALRISPQMVAKYVQTLEHHLSIRLLNRTTRRQSLTEFGQRYFDRCKQLIALAAEADAMARDAIEQPVGKIRLSAPLNFGSGSFISFIQSFLRNHPMVEVELTLSDQYVDLTNQGFEAAIRIGEAIGGETPGLVSRRLKDYVLIPCAAPIYLKQHGTPQTPEELEHHHCASYLFADRTHEQQWIFTKNAVQTPVKLTNRLRINDMRALINAAINGHGIVLAAEETAYDALERGDLVRLLPDYQGPTRPLNLVYQSDLQKTAAMKAFIREAAEHFTSMNRIPF